MFKFQCSIPTNVKPLKNLVVILISSDRNYWSCVKGEKKLNIKTIVKEGQKQILKKIESIFFFL